MLVYHELILPQSGAVGYSVRSISLHRFLELALQGRLELRVPWGVSVRLTRELGVPLHSDGVEPSISEAPAEYLVARVVEGRLMLWHVVSDTW